MHAVAFLEAIGKRVGEVSLAFFVIFFLAISGYVHSVIYGTGSRSLGASGTQLLEYSDNTFWVIMFLAFSLEKENKGKHCILYFQNSSYISVCEVFHLGQVPSEGPVVSHIISMPHMSAWN